MVFCCLECFRKSCENLVKSIWQSKVVFTEKLTGFAKLMSPRVVSLESFSYAQWKKEKPLEITSLALSTSLHLIVLPVGIAVSHKEIKIHIFPHFISTVLVLLFNCSHHTIFIEDAFVFQPSLRHKPEIGWQLLTYHLGRSVESFSTVMILLFSALQRWQFSLCISVCFMQICVFEFPSDCAFSRLHCGPTGKTSRKPWDLRIRVC